MWNIYLGRGGGRESEEEREHEKKMIPPPTTFPPYPWVYIYSYLMGLVRQVPLPFNADVCVRVIARSSPHHCPQTMLA